MSETGVNAALVGARNGCAEASEAASVVIGRHIEPVAVPDDVHRYGKAVEEAKVVSARIAEVRAQVLDASARLKAAHADELRGAKASLSERDKSELEQRLADDNAYRVAASLGDELQALWHRWDARRSRLNREFEIARVDYARTQALDATGLVLDGLRAKLFNAADYFVSKLRGVL